MRINNNGFVGLPILLAMVAVLFVAAGGTAWYLQHKNPEPHFILTDNQALATTTGAAGGAQEGAASSTKSSVGAPIEQPHSSTIIIPQNGFSFTIPEGWYVYNSDANNTGFGYMLMDQRGGIITIQCPPVETNFKAFADLASNHLTFQQQRTFTHAGKTYTISYAEYNPATQDIVGVLVHISGGAAPAEECKLVSMLDRSAAPLNETWTSFQQEIVNGVKQIYTSWR